MKIGVYLCQCGGNISKTVDLAEVTQFVEQQEDIAVIKEHSNMCAGAGQKLIIEDIKELSLDKVVIASCSPLFHEKTFRNTLEKAGMNSYLMEIANLREHASWAYRTEPKVATKKAINLLKASIEKARHNYALEKKKVKMGNKVLVIGGGVAGIQSSLDLAAAGKDVVLVEKEPTIGGNMAFLTKTFPTEDCAACILSPKMAEVNDHPNIDLMSYSEIESISGHRLHFEVTVKRKPRYISKNINMDECLGCEKCVQACPVQVPSKWEQGIINRKAVYIPAALAIPYKYLIDKEACLHLNGEACNKCAEVCPQKVIDFEQEPEIVNFAVDSIVVATGYDLIDPREKPVFGYGKYRNVVTGLEMERIVDHITEIPPPRDIGDKVAFIQCVGSRDEQTGREYCSRVCCMYAIKLAALLKQAKPEKDIYIFYTDLRAFGKGYEEYYKKAQRLGIKFIRGKVAEINENEDNGKLVLLAEDTLSRQVIEGEFDLVVLSSGMQLSKSSEKIAQSLKLTKSPDGFFQEEHPKFKPVDTFIEGVFLAGTAQGPKDIPDTVTQASAAAARVIGTLAKGEFEIDPVLAFVNEDKCTGCGECIGYCPLKALEMKADNKAHVIEAMCVGCGACMAICPEEALDLHGYTNDQLYALIKGVLEDKKDDEYRFILFADESCAYRTADTCGIRKMRYSPDFRILRVPAAVRITSNMLKFAFENGADGVIMGDCPEKNLKFDWGRPTALESVDNAKKVLEKAGIDGERIIYKEFTAGNLPDFINTLNTFDENVKTYGKISTKEISSLKES